jgi:hypothetical protein
MELCDSFASLDLPIRAGVHTGECEVIGEDLGGMAVHIGARVGAAAAPGEVLVSSTVAELVMGSGLCFEGRGDHELKGVPGRWRLLAVTGEGDPTPCRPGRCPCDPVIACSSAWRAASPAPCVPLPVPPAGAGSAGACPGFGEISLTA